MSVRCYLVGMCFFFNDTATTEIYTLSLHDALPIFGLGWDAVEALDAIHAARSISFIAYAEDALRWHHGSGSAERSEEHTSELQSRQYLVCRLLLEKKNNMNKVVEYQNKMNRPSSVN